MAFMKLWLTPDDAANELLSRDPLALLLGMLLDQRVDGPPIKRSAYLL